jgi:hypothetical protein
MNSTTGVVHATAVFLVIRGNEGELPIKRQACKDYCETLRVELFTIKRRLVESVCERCRRLSGPGVSSTFALDYAVRMRTR